MSKSLAIWKLHVFLALVIALVYANFSDATVVRFQTSLGDVDVRLYDTATPLTVANFLGYANADRYDETFIHRNPPGFVVQGGGFRFIPPNVADGVVDPENPDPPVLNEPGISNRRGTIAMAKLAGDPNSATSQWFFNLSDENVFLDEPPPISNEFTVFGRVILNGMDIVDAIDLLPSLNLGPGFEQVPLRGTSSDPLAERLVFIHSISVLNIPAGDYNFNGTVNAADYSVWRADFGSTTKAEADGNGNGVVDAADYVVWRKSLGQALGGGTSMTAAVPEPAGAAMLVLAGWLLLLCGRRFLARR